MCFSIRLRFSETAEGTPGSHTHPVYFTLLPTPSFSVSCSLIEGFTKIDIARAPAIPKKNENGDLGRELTKGDHIHDKKGESLKDFSSDWQQIGSIQRILISLDLRMNSIEALIVK